MRAPVNLLGWGSGGVISVTTEECPARDGIIYGNNATNWGINNTGTWPTANKAIYVPFMISHPILVQQMFWMNGSNVTGSVDLGIFTVAGARIVSLGSTARAGVTTDLELGNIADTYLDSGHYYMAMAATLNTMNFFRSAVFAEMLRSYGVQMETSALPLPANATFATPVNAYIPWFGMVLASTA